VELSYEECWKRLDESRCGVLATLNQHRGVDSVPVVFVLDDRRVVIPVDTVKPKRSARLRRLDNLRDDPRCCLLVHRYVEDWSKLWWARVHALGEEVALTDRLLGLFAARYRPYEEPGAVIGAVLLVPTEVRGWTASPVSPEE
jgi:PPOX class probable F420-dependent enzyme